MFLSTLHSTWGFIFTPLETEAQGDLSFLLKIFRHRLFHYIDQFDILKDTYKIRLLYCTECASQFDRKSIKLFASEIHHIFSGEKSARYSQVSRSKEGLEYNKLRFWPKRLQTSKKCGQNINFYTKCVRSLIIFYQAFFYMLYINLHITLRASPRL